MFLLKIRPAHGDPFEHLLEGDSLVIGRSSAVDLQVPDRFLSRRHLRLFRRDGDWYAEDLGSRNGTLVNGERISEPVRLMAGDELRLSGSSVRLVAPGRPRVGPVVESSELGPHTVLRQASDLIRSAQETGTADLAAPDDVRRYADRLRLLNEVHRALGASIDRDELLELILDRAFEHLQPEEGVVFLKEAEGAYLEAAYRAESGTSSGYACSETLIAEVAEKGLAALVLDVESDERFAAAESLLASGIRSLVAAPLLDGEECFGVVVLHSRLHRRRFDEDDMELLVSLAAVAALRIRNLWLASQAAERQRLEEEVRLARQIQVALLPASLPEMEGWEFLGRNIASRGVSGDYYKLVERAGGDECVLMVADVSGKGIAASLLMASLEALAAGPLEAGEAPDEVFDQVCRRLYERTLPAKYATAFLAVLDRAGGGLRYTNAGHNPALVVRGDGSVEELGTTGVPLGLLQECTYQAAATRLERGDTLVIYTDGLVEATDPAGEEYGLERLAAVCAGCREEPLAALDRAIHDDLDRFVDGEAYADDRTLVAARRL